MKHRMPPFDADAEQSVREDFVEAAVDTKLDIRLAWLIHFKLGMVDESK